MRIIQYYRYYQDGQYYYGTRAQIAAQIGYNPKSMWRLRNKMRKITTFKYYMLHDGQVICCANDPHRLAEQSGYSYSYVMSCLYNGLTTRNGYTFTKELVKYGSD